MSDTKVFEFTPNEACDLTGITGVQTQINAYTSTRTVESITSYTMQGNLYVIVVTT